MDPILAGLLLYLVMMVAVGFVTYRYMNTLDDYVLAGRRLGPWVAAVSERASGESAWFLLGLPGAAYGAGFTEYWSVIGIAGGILASWTFIAMPLRRATAKMGALTLPDYFELRFGDRSRLLRIVSMVVILFFYTLYVAAQLLGACCGAALLRISLPPSYLETPFVTAGSLTAAHPVQVIFYYLGQLEEFLDRAH